MTQPSAKEIISQYEGPLKIDVEERPPSAVVLHLDGVLALDNSSKLRDRISELAKRHDLKKIVLDLGKLTYIDSSGIGTLVTSKTALRKNGTDLVLAQLTEKAQALVQITKLYTVFDVRDSVEQALSQA